MYKVKTVMVVAENQSGIAELTAGAALLGESTVLVYAGDKRGAVNAETAYYMGELREDSYISYIPAIISLVRNSRPQLILLESTGNGRLAAASIAASMKTSVLTDAVELKVEDGAVISKRLVYGGEAFKTEKGIGEAAVVCAGSGLFEAGRTQQAGRILELAADAPGIRFVERRSKEGKSVNLSAARYVVGVGRGFGAEENLSLARALADAIGGEVGCSRPVAEEEKWMPKEAYLGVSGVMIKPEVYIACGISGQVQHMTGVSQARTIIAVNRDKNAPIFEKCDYGIVGDLNTVLPALTKKFQ